jgi:hypothetical protein
MPLLSLEAQQLLISNVSQDLYAANSIKSYTFPSSIKDIKKNKVLGFLQLVDLTKD